MTDKDAVRQWTEQSGSSSTAGRARTAKQYELMRKAEEEQMCLFVTRKNGKTRQ